MPETRFHCSYQAVAKTSPFWHQGERPPAEAPIREPFRKGICKRNIQDLLEEMAAVLNPQSTAPALARATPERDPPCKCGGKPKY